MNTTRGRLELDDLKSAWQALDRRLQRQETLQLHALRRRQADKTRGTLRWLMLRQAIQIAIWLALLALIIVPFWLAHRAAPHLLTMGLVLHAYAVLTIGVSVLQILLMARIDPAAPVVTLQRRLSQLRSLRIKHNLLLSLPWWPLWVVGFAVGMKWATGFDLYLAAPGFFWWTLAAGGVGLIATLWLARHLALRAARTGRPAPMADDLAGHSLRRAIARLDEITAFERD